MTQCCLWITDSWQRVRNWVQCLCVIRKLFLLKWKVKIFLSLQRILALYVPRIKRAFCFFQFGGIPVLLTFRLPSLSTWSTMYERQHIYMSSLFCGTLQVQCTKYSLILQQLYQNVRFFFKRAESTLWILFGWMATVLRIDEYDEQQLSCFLHGVPGVFSTVALLCYINTCWGSGVAHHLWAALLIKD